MRNRFVSKIIETNAPPKQIARGVAVGSFIAVTPTVGLQILLSILLATLVRGNRIAAVAMTFVLNPFIFVPPGYWYFPAYYLGAFLLGIDAVGFSRIVQAYESSESFFDLLGNLASLGIEVYGPMIVGSVVIGVPVAFVMYRISLGIAQRHQGQDSAPDRGGADANGGNACAENTNHGTNSGNMRCASVSPGKYC